MLQRPRGQDSPRAPWVQVLFSWRGGPGPGEPHKLVQVWFNSRPRSHFGASASRSFHRSPMPRTVGAASITRVLQPPHGDQLAGDVSCGDGRMRNRALAAQPLKWGGSSRYARPEPTGAVFLSSTPSVSCGGFIPGLSARVVVWFIGVEVDSSDRFQFARRFTPVSGHYFDRECVYAGRRAFLSVVVPAGLFGGVRDVTTDAPGVGPSTDAGRLLFRGPAGSAGSGACKSRNTDAASVSGGENPSTPDNFHGSRPWLKRTWPKSRTNERSRKCRECRQPQPSPSNPEFPFLPSPGLEPRSTRGPSCATVIRSLFPRRPRSSSRRLRDLLGSGTGSSPASLRLRRTACRVCGVGESKVGESTGLPRRKVWGALSGHCRCLPWQYAGRRLSPPLRAGRSVKKVGANRSPLMTPARRGWSMNRGLPTVTARVSSRLDLFPKVLGCYANDRPTVKTGWKTRTEYFFR